MDKVEEKSPERVDTLNEAQNDEIKHSQIVVQNDFPYTPKKFFLPGKAREIIRNALYEKLNGITYDGEAASGWVREIVDNIKNKLKEMECDRYKIIVQAAIGQKCGQGVSMSCRCFWDPKTDDFAEESFSSDDVFGVAIAFGLYQY